MAKLMLESLRSITQNIIDLRKKRAQQEKLLKEMEYVIYMQYLWESRDPEPFEKDTSYYPRVRFKGGSHTKGWICIVRRSDNVEIRFPVIMRYQNYAGIIDMYDSGELPERFIELVFEHLGGKKQGYPDISTVTNYQRSRDKRLEENARFKKTYGHSRRTLGGILVEALRVTTSGDEIRLDDFPRDDGPPEVVPEEGAEGSKGQEGETVA